MSTTRSRGWDAWGAASCFRTAACHLPDEACKANQWIHVLLPALLAALRALGDAPARSLAALAQRLGIAEAAAATVVTPLEEESAPVVAVPTAAPAAPFCP